MSKQRINLIIVSILFLCHIFLSVSTFNITSKLPILHKKHGKIFYYNLPLITILIPNPVTPAASYFLPNCSFYKNCGKHAEESYKYLFLLTMLVDLGMFNGVRNLLNKFNVGRRSLEIFLDTR